MTNGDANGDDDLRAAPTIASLDLRLADGGEDSMPPTTRCYWVVPGRLLAGAYPGHHEPAKHQAHVESLWRAGIRTFVSLLEPDERNNAGEPFADYATILYELAARSRERAECVAFPIRDVSIPSTATMRAVLDFIDHELVAGRPVYVHCFGGIGRTGTVVGCWLRRHELVSSGEVLKVMATLRRADRERASWRSPETEEQIRFVLGWCET
jgi:hypothetical protein